MIPMSVAIELLSKAAARDNREVTEAAAAAWSEDLNANVTPEDGAAAISAHYRITRDWIMPSDINKGVSSIRSRRIKETEVSEIPPASLDDDPARAAQWQRDYRYAIGSGATTQEAHVYACRALGVAPELDRSQVKEITDGTEMPDEMRSMMARFHTRQARETRSRRVPGGKPVKWQEDSETAPALPVPDREEFLASVAAQGIVVEEDPATE